jgi:hypothetical protein
MRNSLILVVAMVLFATGCNSELALTRPVHHVAVQRIQGDIGYYDYNPVLGGGLINATSNAIREDKLKKAFAQEGFSYKSELTQMLQAALERTGKTVVWIDKDQATPAEPDSVLTIKTLFAGYWKRYDGFDHEHVPAMVVEMKLVDREGKKLCVQRLVSGEDERMSFLSAYRFKGEYDPLLEAQSGRMLQGMRQTMQQFADAVADELGDKKPAGQVARVEP